MNIGRPHNPNTPGNIEDDSKLANNKVKRPNSPAVKQNNMVNEGDNLPSTGDNSSNRMAVMLIFVSCLVFVVTFISCKRKNKTL